MIASNATCVPALKYICAMTAFDHICPDSVSSLRCWLVVATDHRRGWSLSGTSLGSRALNCLRISTWALTRLFLVTSTAAALWARGLLQYKVTLSFGRSPIERFPLL